MARKTLKSLAVSMASVVALSTRTIIGGLIQQSMAVTATLTATLSRGRLIQIVNGTVAYLGEVKRAVNLTAQKTLGYLGGRYTARRK